MRSSDSDLSIKDVTIFTYVLPIRYGEWNSFASIPIFSLAGFTPLGKYLAEYDLIWCRPTITMLLTILTHSYPVDRIANFSQYLEPSVVPRVFCHLRSVLYQASTTHTHSRLIRLKSTSTTYYAVNVRKLKIPRRSEAVRPHSRIAFTVVDPPISLHHNRQCIIQQTQLPKFSVRRTAGPEWRILPL